MANTPTYHTPNVTESPFFEHNYELRDAQREVEALQQQLTAMAKEMEQDKKDLKTMEYINDDLEKRLEGEARARVLLQKTAAEEKAELLLKIKAIEAERDIGRLKSLEERRHNEAMGARLERTQKDLLSMHNRKYKMRAEESRVAASRSNSITSSSASAGSASGDGGRSGDQVGGGITPSHPPPPSESSSVVTEIPDNYIAAQLRERVYNRESLLNNLCDFFGY